MAERLEHTYVEIDKALAALHAKTAADLLPGGLPRENPSSEVTGLSGTETFPLRLPGGQTVFISYANLLAVIMGDADAMNEIAEVARDAVSNALVAGATAGDGIQITPDDAGDKIRIEVDTLDGGTY